MRVYIDAPKSFALTNRFLRMHGWCFEPGRKLQAVRLQLRTREISGLYGTPRPDVRAAVPEAPDDAVGFELWTRVPPGRHRGSLQFLDCGAWREALALDLQVPRWTYPAWLPGGRPTALVAFQLAICPSYPPRAVAPERFPPSRTPGRRPGLPIVIPSFNQAVSLPQTIASVGSVPGAAVEHVVQDGGSTDGSVEALRRHAGRDGVCFRWVSGRDAGEAAAIVQGFARTAGGPDDLMAWINSDDAYLPGALAFVADWFARHPAAAVLYGNRIVIDEAGRETGRWYLLRHDDELLRLNDFVPQVTLFWRRRVWDRVGGLDPSLQFALAWDLLLRFQAAGAHRAPARFSRLFPRPRGPKDIGAIQGRRAGRNRPAAGAHVWPAAVLRRGGEPPAPARLPPPERLDRVLGPVRHPRLSPLFA